MGKPWTRGQKAMAAKPSKRAVAAALAAFAPPDWVAPAREKKRRGKIADDSLEGIGGTGGDLPDDGD